MSFFFSQPFDQNFKFLKNCPYDFQKILHSHSTPKGAPMCAMASKTYGLDVRNSLNWPKNDQKSAIFGLFAIFSKPPYDSNEILYSHSHHVMVLCVQGHENRMIGIRASQTEKDLSRLLFRSCGSCYS